MSGDDELQALRSSLEAMRREHAIVRMRLAEAVSMVEGQHGEYAQLRSALATLEAERERLSGALAAASAERDAQATLLAQDGHRLVAGVAALARRHPWLGPPFAAIVRLALRIAGRG